MYFLNLGVKGCGTYHQRGSRTALGRHVARMRYLQSRMRNASSARTLKPTVVKMLLTTPAAVRLEVTAISRQ